jgi:transcriptional regulator with XRE-family HTH domain
VPEVTPGVISVGERLAAFRRASGDRQDDIVEAARWNGIPWTKSVLTNIEAGRREVSLGECLVLPLIYGRSLADLLCPDDTPTQLIPGVAVRRPTLEKLLGDEVISSNYVKTALQKGRLIINPQPVPVTELHRRVARHLSMNPQDVAAIAAELYGRPLLAERDARVAELLATEGEEDVRSDRMRGLRGRVTRQLIEELRPSGGLDDETDSRSKS